MVNLSIREAVKHFNVSRPTLTKALKTGKISGQQDVNGQWSINPAEIARVYRPRSEEARERNRTLPVSLPLNGTSPNTLSPDDLTVLREQLDEAERRAEKAEARAEGAEALAKERAERIEDLRRMLPSPNQSKKRGWWPWR